MVGSLIREGSRNIKIQFEQLLSGNTIKANIAEEIVYDQLDEDDDAIWSLLLAGGYIKVCSYEDDLYEIRLPNYEVEKMFYKMVKGWFGKSKETYNDFVAALLKGNVKEMNAYMNLQKMRLI